MRVNSRLERANRIKYIRALEGALIKITKAVKRDDFSSARFELTRAQIVKTLSNVERVQCDSEFSKHLEIFVSSCCFEKKSHSDILSGLNALDKLRRSRLYKKDKHRKKILEEE